MQFFNAKKAAKDIPKLKATKLDDKIKSFAVFLRENPLQASSPYEKLECNLQGTYSRRINI